MPVGRTLRRTLVTERMSRMRKMMDRHIALRSTTKRGLMRRISRTWKSYRDLTFQKRLTVVKIHQGSLEVVSLESCC